jgi:protein-ribulosamine 3-kinase
LPTSAKFPRIGADQKRWAAGSPPWHQETAGKFGFPRHCYLGTTFQPNDPNESWADFFIEVRLRYTLQLFEQRHPGAELGPFYDFLPKAHAILAQHPAMKPFTVHGDLWNGNALCTRRAVNRF